MHIKHLWNKFSDLAGATIFHPQYFIKKEEHDFIKIVTKAAYGRFLDIGCGRQWYRDKMERNVSKYYALDHPKISKLYKSHYPIEVLSDATNIPLDTNGIDMAMMLMVLEHLPDPEKALQEVKRVLKKNGRLFICTVENYPGHDLPYNYYHFTKYGLKEILKKTGFKIQKLISFGNFWETQVVYQNVYLMRTVKKLADKKGLVIVAVIVLIFFTPIMILGNIFAIILGGRKVSEEFALGHIVIATK